MRVLAALAVLAAAEIAVLYLVGSQIGFLGLLAVLLGAALLGGWAISHEGRRSLAALGQALRSGRPADAELADGMLVAAAGVLLVLPGLISDVAALLLLLPPVRRLLGRRVARSRPGRPGGPRVVAFTPSARPGAPRDGSRRPFAGQVVEGQVLEPSPDPERRQA